MGDDFSSVAADDNEILGIMGCTPRSFWLDGKLCRAAEITTWVVQEKARGKGVGRGIMADLQQRYDVLIGLGISKAAMPIYMTSGFSFMSGIPRFFRILDLEPLQTIADFNRLGENLARRPLRATKSYDVSDGTIEQFAQIASSYATDANLYIRDRAYLKWRFTDHPAFDHQLHIISCNGSSAAIATRIFETSGIKALFVVDVIGNDRSLPGAVRFAEDFAERNGAAFVEMHATNSRVSRHFRDVNWFSATDDYWFRLPHLFYPIEMREPQTTSAVIWAREECNSILDLGKLHVMKSDIDLDRPTIAFYEQNGIPLQ